MPRIVATPDFSVIRKRIDAYLWNEESEWHGAQNYLKACLAEIDRLQELVTYHFRLKELSDGASSDAERRGYQRGLEAAAQRMECGAREWRDAAQDDIEDTTKRDTMFDRHTKRAELCERYAQIIRALMDAPQETP